MNTLLNRIALPLGIVLIISLIIGAYFILQNTDSVIPETKQQIIVDISGAVRNPGVYTFEQDTIVEDAITKAGGFADTADLTLIAKTINRASLLNNHSKIYIPYLKEDNIEDQNSSSTIQLTNNLVNINTADLLRLDTLPGIGPITASRIIDYRETKGTFNNKKDLMKVEGVSTSKYNKLIDLITV